jgi:hypothetical protein
MVTAAIGLPDKLPKEQFWALIASGALEMLR